MQSESIVQQNEGEMEMVIPAVTLNTGIIVDDERTAREFNWNNGLSSSVNHYFQDFIRDYKKKNAADEEVNASAQILVAEMVMRGGSFEKLTKKEKMNIKTKFIRYIPF